jgi:hypothetical protein
MIYAEVEMKKIITLFVILCLLFSLFACTEEPAVTGSETEPDTVAETDETVTDVTETVTDAEQTTETDEQTETETETEPTVDEPLEYTVYDPLHASGKGELVLYDTMKYKLEYNYTELDYGFPVYMSFTETGNYEIDDPGVDLILERAFIQFKITFDSDENKEAYQTVIKNQYLMQDISGDAYDTAKKAANGGYSVSAEEIGDVSKLYPVIQCLGSKAVLDKNDKTAYFQINGVSLSDNEYYITDSGYTLILNGDGTCRMRYDSLKKDDKGFGEYIAIDIYEGTYTRSGSQITCVITQDTLRYDFTEDLSEQAYKEYYEQQYSGGFLGKVYYDYYIALVSEGGYTDTDMSDQYIIKLEDHTHTAIIIESPDSEM